MAAQCERRLVVEGIAMRWLEAGEGVPVVMVHGIPTSAELWRSVLPRVQGARAMAWEMVGYGDSIPDGRERDISVGRQADYLAAWLRALGIRRAVLVGHDLGGGVAQIAAVRRPDVCAGLVLTNAIGYDSWPVWPMHMVRRLHPLVRRIPDRLMAGLFRQVFRWMHDPVELGEESARIHWSHYARHGGAEGLVRQARSLDPHDTLAVASRLPELAVPTRIVWGDADRFQSVAWAHRFAGDLGATVEIIPGGGHFTPEDHPGRIAAAITGLVSRL